jgi:integrase
VTLGGRDFYLGPYGSPQSRAEYDRLVAEWLVNGRRVLLPPGATDTDLTVNELALAFLRWAEGYYRKGGKVTSEVSNIKTAIRPLRRLHGHTPAREFGPLALKAVRDELIRAGLTRSGVNRGARLIVRAFRWGAEHEMVPPSIYHGLKAVSGLRKGRSEARESEPVRPVPDADVDAIGPFVAPQVWAMVRLQRLTGMRPGEVVSMRTGEVDISGEVWLYTPGSHKTEHHGRERRIFIGPQAREILRPWLRADPGEFLFSPSEAESARRAGLRALRKTRVQPSQRDRSKVSPRKQPLGCYTVDSYRRAIQYGIARANLERAGQGIAPIPHWHPNQLRHNAATRLRREFGLDAARAVLGHSSPAVTEVYAELDEAKAAEVMGRVG